MIHCSDIKEIKVLANPDEVNELLRARNEYWKLVDVQRSECGFLFLLGQTYGNPLEEYKHEGTELS